MKNIVDYYDNYLKKYVLLLADVFEKFFSKSFKFYKQDPSYYSSSPGLSWHSMLKMTGIKLELISDINKDFFIEERLRGEIYYICKRSSKGNNKYMKNYHPSKESKFIVSS